AGSTLAHYQVLDENGKQVARQRLNETLKVEPGLYTVKINNAMHTVEVYAGMLSNCSTGTLILTGDTPDTYHVMDTTNQLLAYAPLGKPMSFFPGSFLVSVNNTGMRTIVKLK